MTRINQRACVCKGEKQVTYSSPWLQIEGAANESQMFVLLPDPDR